jgi:RNA polymerase sigma-70 factor (ECF subfamily)
MEGWWSLDYGDGELVKNLQDGDEKAFVALYDRHKRTVYVFCLKMLGDGDMAKDITQGVFLKLFERRFEIKNPDRLGTWLLVTARNDCLMKLREKKVMMSINSLPVELEPIEISSPESEAKLDAEIDLVNQAIAQLQPAYREVIVLREYQKLSYKQIAEIIDVAESTVKFRLFAARRQLYKYLKPLLAGVGNHELR